MFEDDSPSYKKASQHQSWHRTSIRVLLAELIEKHPKADVDRLVRLYDELARESDEYRIAAVEYGVINSYQHLGYKLKKFQPRPAEGARYEAEVKATADSIKEQILLLNLEMPNGKRMRWCTGAEMTKFGGAYQRIGRKVGKTKMVGSVLDEKQVRAILG